MKVDLMGHPDDLNGAETEIVDPAVPILVRDPAGMTRVYHLYGHSSRGVPIYRYTRTE